MKTSFPRSLYASGKVRRWHTHPTLEQTVADHSWGVAVIIAMLHPDPSADLLKEALFHDAHELVSGDVPSPAKDNDFLRWEERIEKQFRIDHDIKIGLLTELDRKWLKLADNMEALSFLSFLDEQDPVVRMAITRFEVKIRELVAEIGVTNADQLTFFRVTK